MKLRKRYHNKWNTRLAPMVAFSAATLLGPQWVRSEEPATELPEVVVEGEAEKKMSSPKYTEPLRDVPQTITVIDQKAIQEQGATTLRDVLRNVPGISIQAGEGGVPAGDNLSIRGFGARTDMFIDGVRDFGGYSRDSFNFEQVEVVKGPASSYAGRGSSGGAINMSSKSPRLQNFNRATLGGGTDEYFRSTIDSNFKVSDESALRVNALWHSQEVSGRDAVDAKRWGVAPSLAFGLGTETRTKFGYFHLSQDNTPDYGIPWVPTSTGTVLGGFSNQPLPVDTSNFYGLKQRDYEKTDTDIATHQVEHDINSAVGLRNIVQFGRTKRDSVVTAPRFVDTITTTGTIVNRQIQSRDQVDVIVADQLDVTSRFKTLGMEHALVSGLELSQESSKNYARAGVTSTTNWQNPDPNDRNPGPVARTGAKTDVTSKTVGVYAFDTLKLNGAFELVGGIRWDRFNVNQTTTAVNNVATSLERTDEMVSWRGGLVVKPSEKGSIYASYGTSFNPSAEGLTLGNAGTATNSIHIDPEESRTYEFGTKWDLMEARVLLSAALFRTEKINARTEDPTIATDVVVLEGEQRVDGAEFGVSGKLTDTWDATLSYTFMESEVTKSKNQTERGLELANTPKHSASLWSVYRVLQNLDVGLGAQFVDSRFNSNTVTATSSPRKAPSYWLADAMVAYEINKSFTLRLNGYNLLDKEYIDRVGGGHFIPGAGRSATLTTEIKF